MPAKSRIPLLSPQVGLANERRRHEGSIWPDPFPLTGATKAGNEGMDPKESLLGGHSLIPYFRRTSQIRSARETLLCSPFAFQVPHDKGDKGDKAWNPPQKKASTGSRCGLRDSQPFIILHLSTL